MEQFEQSMYIMVFFYSFGSYVFTLGACHCQTENECSRWQTTTTITTTKVARKKFREKGIR